MITNRRNFIGGCCSAIAAMSGARISSIAMAQNPGDGNDETLVMVFLRGGIDGLNLVPPIAGDDRGHYEAFRPEINVPATGDSAALPLNEQFGLHPSAAPLYELFQDNKLAIVHAVGSAGSRSHFEAQEYMELGTPGQASINSGWLTRHLQSAPNLPSSILMPSLAAGSNPPTSLAASSETVTMSSPSSFSLSSIGDSSWRYSEQRTALRKLFNVGSSGIHAAGIQAINAADLIEAYVTDDYEPRSGVTYPNNTFGRQLEMIAQMIKLQVGMRVATIDYGGWDTHNQQGNGSGGFFAGQVGTLAQGLAALYNDLDESIANPFSKRLTVVVQSEFGRRVRENGDRGTDHGTAFPLFVLGGNVNGGLHGQWPGLAHEQLYDNADLRPTSDYRQILSEILIRRFGNPYLGQVFPDYSDYEPMGVIIGEDISPVYESAAPDVPAGLIATLVSSQQVLVEWESVTDATSYQIERRAGEAGLWTSLVTTAGDTVEYSDETIEENITYYYRVRTVGSGGSSEFSEEVAALTRSALEQWRLDYFGTDANAGDAADMNDYSGDGLTNLMAYALGLDPLALNTGYTTAFTPGRPRIVKSETEISLIYVRPKNRTDINYEVRWSDNLLSWTAVQDVSDGEQGDYERRIATVPLSGESLKFLDLRVSRNDL